MAPEKTTVLAQLGNYPFLAVEVFRFGETALRLQWEWGGGGGVGGVIMSIPLPSAEAQAPAVLGGPFEHPTSPTFPFCPMI